MEKNFEKLNKEENFSEKFRIKTADDPHWENIDSGQIEESDVLLLNKFEKGNLTEKEIDQRIKELEKEGKKFDNSSYALSAMLKNKLISKKYWSGKGRGERKEAQI